MIIKNGMGIVNEVYTTFLTVRALEDGETVYRSIELSDGLVVDIAEDGSIIGIEKIGNQLDLSDLIQVLKRSYLYR